MVVRDLVYQMKTFGGVYPPLGTLRKPPPMSNPLRVITSNLVKRCIPPELQMTPSVLIENLPKEQKIQASPRLGLKVVKLFAIFETQM